MKTIAADVIFCKPKNSSNSWPFFFVSKQRFLMQCHKRSFNRVFIVVSFLLLLCFCCATREQFVFFCVCFFYCNPILTHKTHAQAIPTFLPLEKQNFPKNYGKQKHKNIIFFSVRKSCIANSRKHTKKKTVSMQNIQTFFV